MRTSLRLSRVACVTLCVLSLAGGGDAQFPTPPSPSIPDAGSTPAVIPSYTELFGFVRPDAPGVEVTSQSQCPFDEAGLTEWGSLFSTQTTVVLPANTRVVAGRSDLWGRRFDTITVPASSELILRDEDIAFSVKGIYVEGKLRIGAPTCRLQGPIDIRFYGSHGEDVLHGFGTKGLAVVGTGEVDIFGRRFAPTWTRLARKVESGDDRVYLQEAVNWFPGQEVVVLTTIPDDTDLNTANQNEVMVVRSVGDNGRLVQFTSALQHNHYAGTEYQGEVALLSRQVMLSGEPDLDGFGGHLLAAGRRARIAGVASRYMGQTNAMGRYPFHMHLLGSNSGSYFSDNVARDTYFRCYTIHGTHDAVVTENIAFNATGSCYYVEDGVEENNTFSHNMAAYVKPIGVPASGVAQAGEVVLQDLNAGGLRSGQRIQPADASATGFYFSNAHNSIIGNVASGGWAGFGFPGLPTPIGVFKNTNFVPNSRPTLKFLGNTAHSTGNYWSAAAGVYIGGELAFTDDSKTRLEWASGRADRSTRLESEQGFQSWEGTALWMRFENTRVYASNKGMLHWGKRAEIDGFEFHDVGRSVTLFGEAWLGNGLVNGVSGNADAGFADRHHDGFQFYDISVKSVVTGVTFRNFEKATCRQAFIVAGKTDWPKDDSSCSAYTPGQNMFNVVWSALFHSDVFKPQQISATRGITYENVDTDLLVGIKIVESGASRFFNFIDFDGSATLEGRPTIVGSNLNWWEVCSDCRFQETWKTWLCPKAPAGVEEREVAHIKVTTPDISPSNGGIGQSGVCGEGGPTKWDWSNCNVGYVALWNRDSIVRKSTITQNNGITGVTGTGWYMWLDGGAPKKFELAPEQVPNESTLRFATSYPAGTTFTVTAEHRWQWRLSRTLEAASSLAEVEADPLGKYFFDTRANTLYLRPKLPETVDGGKFVRGGAWVYDTHTAYKIIVEASCAADWRGFCAVKPTERIPDYNVPCPGLSAVTAAPATAAPRTSAPWTAAPDTTAPRTSAPRTAAPDTTAPRTSAPRTNTPVAPVTAAPSTERPAVQRTEAPRTGAPATSAPRTAAPRTSAPDTAAPRTDAPRTAAPRTNTPVVPETAAPSTAAPRTRAPDTSAPRTSAPRTNTPVSVPPTSCAKTLKEWDNCRKDTSCCPSGTQCFEKGRYYAQCRKSCPSNSWSCVVLGTSAPTPPPPPPSTSCNGVELRAWDNCLKNTACCPSGTQCFEQSQYYAQCRYSCNFNDWTCRVLG